MKAALISLGSKSSLWIVEEMKEYFDEVDSLNIENITLKFDKKPKIMYNNEEMKHYDCVYIRGPFRHATFLQTLSVILQQTMQCYLPIKPEAFNIVHNKILTQAYLATQSIPMPFTIFSPTFEKTKEELKEVNYPVVLKYLKGTQGKGVIYLESYASASSTIDALDKSLIIQDYIESNSSDIRIIVAGEKIIGAMRRVGLKEEKRANIHAGGHGEKIVPDERLKKIAIKTAEILKSDIIAVDILESERGYYVIEANLSPGLQGITKATNENIARKIAEFLFKKTKEYVDQRNQEKSKEILQEVNVEKENQIIGQIELRGNRILLPDFATKLSKFKDNEDVIIKMKEGEIKIKKF